VIGIPSLKYGEEVMAWVKPKPGAALCEDELVRFCTGKIATYKIPRLWKVHRRISAHGNGESAEVSDARDRGGGIGIANRGACRRRREPPLALSASAVRVRAKRKRRSNSLLGYPRKIIGPKRRRRQAFWLNRLQIGWSAQP